MRVLVTGGTGFIGAHTVAALLDAGHEPRLLVRSPDRARANLAPLGVDVSRLDLVVGDMVDPAAVARAVAGVDAAIHAAAMVAPLDRAHAQQTVETNVDGTRNVLGAALEAGCDPVVHVSSVAAVFDPAVPVMHADLPPAVHADSPYTRSKALADAWARDRQAEGAPVVIVYPGGVTGPAAGDALGEVAEGFTSMLRSGCLVVREGGLTIIDVRDVARVLVAVLSPGLGPRRFMAGGRLTTLPEVAVIIRDVTGRRFPVLPTPGFALRALGAASDRLRRLVPFRTVFTKEAMELLTLVKPTDDSAVHEVLGVDYRPPRESVAAALAALHAAGRLSARQVGRVAVRG